MSQDPGARRQYFPGAPTANGAACASRCFTRPGQVTCGPELPRRDSRHVARVVALSLSGSLGLARGPGGRGKSAKEWKDWCRSRAKASFHCDSLGRRNSPALSQRFRHAYAQAWRRIGVLYPGRGGGVASYSVNPEAVAWAQRLIDSGQYVLDSDWGEVQPRAGEQNAFLESHSWEEYARWHLGLTDGATDHTKARYAFAYGDFRRLHRMGIIACHYRAAEWRHKDIELAAHDLLQRLDRRSS